MKKQKLLMTLVLAIYILAVMILLYPIVANKLAERNQSVVIGSYEGTIDKQSEKALRKERKKCDDYNVSLFKHKVMLTDPFDVNAPDFPDVKYDALLTMDEAMAYVEIPKIDVNLPVYHGTEEEVLSKGVGHLKGTSLPVGGTGTHAVLSAHCGLPTAELFTYLEKLEIGDLFYVTSLGEKMAYRVDDINIVTPDDTKLLRINPERDLVTLITCTPYAVNTHRLLVRGERTEYNEDEYRAEGDKGRFSLDFTPVEIVQILAMLLSIVPLIMFIRFFVIGPKKDDDDEEDKGAIE